jgi:hypothetical protein
MLADAWDQGYDAVLLTNYPSPGGKTGQQILVVKDPAQLRSRWAACDPRAITSADLLAGLGAAAVGAHAAIPQFQDAGGAR